MSKLKQLVELARPHLEPGETILGAAQGAYRTTVLRMSTVRKGVLIATDRRVVFYAKKLANFELESVAYQAISSFEQGKDAGGHSITLVTPGRQVHLKWIAEGPDLDTLTRQIKAGMDSARTR
ncbi:PH domain-containing protein [Sanguibacter gelidistatuariae]|uniref:PH domain-containing protein n=1 Tax=Sanguibacter gelidistatuariae TaxID=1814289 RepID=A0A1G6GW71_9MICO|nr:PH domain-containing protein [Sanguibacter gelidistatuariae]SDB85386.1 PH domain-containing protein [Sanguibacter gelidistatuariae]